MEYNVICKLRFIFGYSSRERVSRTVAKKIVDPLKARSGACWDVPIVSENERENAGTKQEDKLAC